MRSESAAYEFVGFNGLKPNSPKLRLESQRSPRKKLSENVSGLGFSNKHLP